MPLILPKFKRLDKARRKSRQHGAMGSASAIAHEIDCERAERVTVASDGRHRVLAVVADQKTLQRLYGAGDGLQPPLDVAALGVLE